ncbi:MAG: cofactor assembly of complex C subunit B, partial [bacterium]
MLPSGSQRLLRRGLLADTEFSLGPLCQHRLVRPKAISLVDFSLYPGRVEFEPLLADLPAVVVQPV